MRLQVSQFLGHNRTTILKTYLDNRVIELFRLDLSDEFDVEGRFLERAALRHLGLVPFQSVSGNVRYYSTRIVCCVMAAIKVVDSVLQS